MIYVSDIINKFNGKLICGDINLPLVNFSKDSRTINPGDIYIGINGENFDGNTFYETALEKGASCCILDNPDIVHEVKGKTVVLVEDTLKCIQSLAKYKRSLYDIPVIGVTGSVGKTSTKDMIASVLETKYKVLKNEGNNNNEIGLPLTILKLKDEEIMVTEMGMNHFGEISLLTDIAKPTIGVITNIGTAHIGYLGSRENIMKAKLEIIEGLSGPLLINNDNDIMHANIDYIKKLNNIITFGMDNKSDYMVSDINGSKFKINGVDMETPIANTAFIYNSLVAYIIGKLCNINDENIRKGIKNLKLSSNRLEYKKTKNNVTIIDDTYNASLDSIKASLELLKKVTGRRIVVIGDILEVDGFNKEIHEDIAKELLKNNLDFIVTIGTDIKYADKYLEDNGFNNKKHFSKENESYEFIDSLLKPGDTILLKGSNGINLKNIVNHLMK